MWKSSKSRAEQHFAASGKKDDKTIKQKEKTQRERDDRMARLRELRLAKEAAELGDAAEAAVPEGSDEGAAAPRLPRVHPHRS